MKLRHFRLHRFIIALFSFLNRHSKLFIIIFGLSLLSLLSLKINQLFARYRLSFADLTKVTQDPISLLAHTNDRTNFLILGIRGSSQDGPDLSDTILVVSYHHPSHHFSLISVPRDLWVDSLRAKINTAYHYGNLKTPDGGISLSQGSILETLGVPIHYTIVINFSAFEQIINYLGGVDIRINPGFTDPMFPISGKENALPESSRYETISFATGSAHLDGSMALKFVRSRHADGAEGTDFARNRRQQQLISAIRQQIFSAKVLLNQNKINDLINIITNNVISNIPSSLYPSLVRLALDSRSQTVDHINLSTEPDDQGVSVLAVGSSKEFHGQWVLIAKDNNWKALQQYISNRLNSPQP